MRTRVKICGVRTVEDALLAAGAGADAIGIIQVPGAKRRVSTAVAAEIAQALPSFVTPVLVFADSTFDDISAACRTTGVRTVQLHGHEHVDAALELHNALGVSIIKRLEVGVTLHSELDHWSLLNRNVLAGIVLEGPGRGGTGTETDWDSLHWILSEFEESALPPLTLAGGLTPDNVSMVIRRFHPHAVDTSSGVESPAEPLKKDRWLLEAFLEAVRKTDADVQSVVAEDYE